MRRATTADDAALGQDSTQDSIRETLKQKPIGWNLCLLYDGQLNDLSDEWSQMPQPLVIDSGASETVLPQDWFTEHPLDTNTKKFGKPYTSASNHTVYNMGERMLTPCTLDHASERTMKFQVADVNKALGSASQIVKNENRVVFDLDEQGNDYSYAENKTSGDRLWLRERHGVYVLDMLVAPPGYQRQKQENKSDFIRQGR